MRIREIAQSRVRYGYRKIRVLLNREGWNLGKYLVYRLYKEEGLALKKRPKHERKAVRHREERFIATAPNQAWSIDFVADQLQDGTRFRALTMLDVYTREAIAIEVGQSLKGDDVVRTLNRMKQERGAPKVLFCDNKSEFTSQAMALWAYQNGMKIDFSRLGKPTDNAFVESFNGRVVLTDLSRTGRRPSHPVLNPLVSTHKQKTKPGSNRSQEVLTSSTSS